MYIYIYKCSPHQYWRLEKKKLQKIFMYFHGLRIYFSNCYKIKGPIQVLASALEKYYRKLTFKINANNS
jgi:hypothetical protein